MKPVTAAGGVIYRKRDDACEVVLIYRNDVWDLPKGKKEEGESIEECARREVSEEVGIPFPELETFLTTTYHEYERGGQRHGKKTHWYRMKTAAENFKAEKVEGITALEWVSVQEALKRVGFDNLREVLNALQASLK